MPEKGQPTKTPEIAPLRIQAKLDKGQSVNIIAKQEGVRESAISYGIKQATLADGSNGGSTFNILNELDQSASLGIATTRYENRMVPAVSGASNATAHFGAHEALCGAGVLFLLPALPWVY